MPPDPPEIELGEDEVLVVLQAGEDVEGALIVSIVGVFTNPMDVPENKEQMHWSALRVFVDTDMPPIPAMRFQPTPEVLSDIARGEEEKKKMLEKRKRGDYS